MSKSIVSSERRVDDLLDDLGTGISQTGASLATPGRSGAHYYERVEQQFILSEKASTTILMAGLTIAQDRFVCAAFRGLGYRMQVLDLPDNYALQLGKEFGNRGQCNPTYFTVGNLLKYLKHLRDDSGLSVDEIKQNYIFLTAGACGPCRFGTYVTEYRKALRDAGFGGFRVVTVSQTGGAYQQLGEGGGLRITPTFFLSVVKALVVGDALNALMYRIRPYEIDTGETDRVIEQCRSVICQALAQRKSLVRAVLRCRRLLATIKVDRSRVKPKVSIIGEFWAMTTEGDGNYHLQRFLESEGAEVDIQLVTGWLLYLIWQSRFDSEKRRGLRTADGGRRGLRGVNVRLRLAKLWLAKKALLGGFHTYARLIGLRGYHFADMDEMAQLANPYYDNDIRGGEGHMEVGKLLGNIKHNKVNMTLSVKPFGCMPSSGVSDGVQSAITEKYPHGIFLPIETTGDGAVNVYSRVQMQLFRAKKSAHKEFDSLLAEHSLTPETYRQRLHTCRWHQNALHHSPHYAACTAANVAAEALGLGRRSVDVH